MCDIRIAAVRVNRCRSKDIGAGAIGDEKVRVGGGTAYRTLHLDGPGGGDVVSHETHRRTQRATNLDRIRTCPHVYVPGVRRACHVPVSSLSPAKNSPSANSSR